MPLITQAYFIGELNLSLSSIATGTLTSVWIPRYENEYLYKALGYGFATEFITGLGVMSPDQKWLDLRDGKTYTVNDVEYRWEGFANSIYKTPVANYVYCTYMANNASTTLGVGEGAPAVQNAVSVNPSQKIHRAWAEMIQMNQSLYHYLNHNEDTYTTWKYNQVDCFGSLNAFNL